MATDTPSRRRIAVKATAAVSAIALLVSGCASPVAGPNGLYAQPIGNAPVTANPTPYSTALVCLGQGRDRHQRGALGDLAPAVGLVLAGVVADPPDRDARGG